MRKSPAYPPLHPWYIRRWLWFCIKVWMFRTVRYRNIMYMCIPQMSLVCSRNMIRITVIWMFRMVTGMIRNLPPNYKRRRIVFCGVESFDTSVTLVRISVNVFYCEFLGRFTSKQKLRILCSCFLKLFSCSLLGILDIKTLKCLF